MTGITSTPEGAEARQGVRRGFLPPYLLETIAARADSELASRARSTLDRDGQLRRSRTGRSGAVVTPVPAPTPPAAGERAGGVGPRRVVSDAAGTTRLPGEPARREGEAATGDAAVDEAYAGLGHTWGLFHEAFARDSLDGRGLPLLATVHYGRDYVNAFWDGTQMVLGDGDGRLFNRFTLSLDVIAHELTHGVVEHTAGLLYRGQPGALNESISDVFGALTRQRVLGQTADQADWLIGVGLFTDAVQGDALRSMKEPGTAYDDPVLGTDPQPGHLDGYVETTEDNGGVHINSGIPNKAFHELAVTLGGNAWEAAGQIWYDTLTGDIAADCDFTTFAGLTVAAAAARYGEQSPEHAAVQQAWASVGVLGAGMPAGTGPSPSGEQERGGPAGGDEAGGGAAPGAPGDAAPPPEAEVVLRRSGGLAGMVRERVVALRELPGEDARDWQRLLAGRTLYALTEQAPRSDAFSYRVCCDAVDLDVTVAEPVLPEPVLELFERTLGRP